MRLVHVPYHLELMLKENQVTVLSIENPRAYAEMVGDFWRQTQGETGGFVLSEREKIKNMAKEAVCIFNPFSLDCNEKKIINKVYQELKEQAGTRFVTESADVNGTLVTYLEELTAQASYALEYDLEFDVTALLKMYNVRLVCCGGSLLEKIVEYLKVIKRICHIDVIMFVGLKQYLTECELLQLYEFVFYEKIHLIVVESTHSKQIKGEKSWLIDKDLCIIELS